MNLLVMLLGVAIMAYFLLFKPPQFLLKAQLSDLDEWWSGFVSTVVWLLLFILFGGLYYSIFPDPDLRKPTAYGGSFWGPLILIVASGIPSLAFNLWLHDKLIRRSKSK